MDTFFKILIVIAILIFAIVIAGQIWARTASRPSLGLHNGTLTPLPNTPNCVATQSGQGNQVMEPITFAGDSKSAQQRLITLLNEWPRTNIIQNEPGYIWVVFRSAFFGFPDDVEFLIENQTIHFRSASRLGYSDMGVNRKRMAQIKAQFEN